MLSELSQGGGDLRLEQCWACPTTQPQGEVVAAEVPTMPNTIPTSQPRPPSSFPEDLTVWH